MIALRELRRARAWSQADLAEQAHLNITTIVLIESERFEPCSLQLRQLADALGRNLEELSPARPVSVHERLAEGDDTGVTANDPKPSVVERPQTEEHASA